MLTSSNKGKDFEEYVHRVYDMMLNMDIASLASLPNKNACLRRPFVGLAERGIRTILLTPLLITISKFQSLQVSVKSRFKQLFNLTFPLLFCLAKIRILEVFYQ